MKRRLINGISIRLSQKNFGQEEDIRLSAFLPIDKTDSAIGKNIRKMNARLVFWHGLCCFIGKMGATSEQGSRRYRSPVAKKLNH